MSTLSDPPKPSFRLSQLIYDTRYRSITIQTIAFLLIMFGLIWLVNNTVQNLEALGKDFDFGFLGSSSNYDINQQLIAYDSQRTHARAALVGILNTLLIAFLGCIAATIIGVFVGVLRLSKNWIVSRLMAVYVEGFRNVPLLLWILLIFAIMTESMPVPSSFRANAEGIAENSMLLGGSIAITNQGTFFPAFPVSSLSWLMIVALVISIFAIGRNNKRANQIQNDTGERPQTFLVNTAIFIVPIVVVYFVTSLITNNNQYTLIVAAEEPISDVAAMAASEQRFDYCSMSNLSASLSARNVLEAGEVELRRREFFGQNDALVGLERGRCAVIAVPAADAQSIVDDLPASANVVYSVVSDQFGEGPAIRVDRPTMTETGIPRFEGGLLLRNSLIALWLALSLYTGAFIAEIVRAGIMAVSKGQSEAAFALGMRPNRTMNLVILPQAMRVIIPPLISQFLNLTKNSSLALAVGYMDVRSTLGGITVNQTGKELEGILLLGLFYLITSILISSGMNVYNNSMKLKER